MTAHDQLKNTNNKLHLSLIQSNKGHLTWAGLPDSRPFCQEIKRKSSTRFKVSCFHLSRKVPRETFGNFAAASTTASTSSSCLRTETCGTLLVMRLCDADSMSLLQRSCSWRQGWVCVKDALFLLLCSIHRCSVPCAAGVACLHLEQQLAAALEDDGAQMAKAEARASESRRVLQVLASLPLFRGGGRGACCLPTWL